MCAEVERQKPWKKKKGSWGAKLDLTVCFARSLSLEQQTCVRSASLYLVTDFFFKYMSFQYVLKKLAIFCMNNLLVD